MTKHTQMTWEVSVQPDTKYEGLTVYSVLSWSDTPKAKERSGHLVCGDITDKQIAQLIAAAPAMYDCLENAITEYDNGGLNVELFIQEARAAIAKEKGE